MIKASGHCTTMAQIAKKFPSNVFGTESLGSTVPTSYSIQMLWLKLVNRKQKI